MGNSSSSSEVDATVNAMITQMNTVAQGCTGTTYQAQSAYQGPIYASGPGSSITTCGINQNQQATLDLTCVASNTTKQNMQQSVQQTITQQTQAISQFLSLANSDASSVTKLMQSLSASMINAYTGSCVAQISQAQTATQGGATAVGGATINIGCINQNQGLSDLANCTLIDGTVQSAIQAIKDNINQNTKAKSKGPLGFLSDLANAFGGIFKGITGLIVGAIILIVIAAVVILVIYLLFHFLHKPHTTTTTTTSILPATSYGTAVPATATGTAAATATGTAGTAGMADTGLPATTGAYSASPSAPPLETSQVPPQPQTSSPVQANGRFYYQWGY